MPNNGDAFSAELDGIARELEQLQALPRLTVEKAAPKIDGVISQELAQGVGPRGEPWPALKDGSGRTPFSSSDRMRRQIVVVPDGLRVRGKLNAPWNVHQYGNRNAKKGTPARKIFQTGELSPSWEKAMKEGAEEALTELTPKLRAVAK